MASVHAAREVWCMQAVLLRLPPSVLETRGGRVAGGGVHHVLLDLLLDLQALRVGLLAVRLRRRESGHVAVSSWHFRLRAARWRVRRLEMLLLLAEREAVSRCDHVWEKGYPSSGPRDTGEYWYRCSKCGMTEC